MRDIEKSGLLAAIAFSVAMPSFALAESAFEPKDFGAESDGSDIYVQLEEDSADDSGQDYGSQDGSADEDYSDFGDEQHGWDEDQSSDIGDEKDIVESDDGWVTTMGGDDDPIYFEFANGSGPVQRGDQTPDAQNPILAASDGLDVTLGINVHDKLSVAAQCQELQKTRQTYHAFYKLYCD